MSSRIHVVAFAAAGVCVLAEPVLSEPLFNLPSPDANRQAPLRGTGIDAYLSLTQFYDSTRQGALPEAILTGSMVVRPTCMSPSTAVASRCGTATPSAPSAN